MCGLVIRSGRRWRRGDTGISFIGGGGDFSVGEFGHFTLGRRPAALQQVFLDALAFNKPEIFVGSAHTKFDDKLELKDQPTIDFIKQHLAGFDKFIRKVSGKK